MTTHNGLALRYKADEIPLTGLRGSGIKAINLKDDYVINGESFNNPKDEYALFITDKGTAKRVKLEEFDQMTRARKGLLAIRDVKTNPYKLISSLIINNKSEIGILTNEITYHKYSEFSDFYLILGILVSTHAQVQSDPPPLRLVATS